MYFFVQVDLVSGWRSRTAVLIDITFCNATVLVLMETTWIVNDLFYYTTHFFHSPCWVFAAQASNTVLIWKGVSSGCLDRTNATIPVICGAAKLLPVAVM